MNSLDCHSERWRRIQYLGTLKDGLASLNHRDGFFTSFRMTEEEHTPKSPLERGTEEEAAAYGYGHEIKIKVLN